MKIGIDLLGVDDKNQLYNFVNSYNDNDVTLVVYGLEEDLGKINERSNVEKKLCTEEVYMSDEPARVHRKKKDASMIKMLSDLHEGYLDITISGGSTGAYMASGIFILGRIEGVAKPSLATMLPTTSEHKFLLTDLGANVEASIQDLVNYAKLGNFYSKYVYGIENPKTALLNIGVEENKGNKLFKETHNIFKETLENFSGNLEARDILEHNNDVVITDGFTGNMVLKTMEGTFMAVNKLFKNVFLENIVSKLAALMIKSGLKSMKKKISYSEYGGAVLLGLQKPAIKIHGSADSRAIFCAVEQAKQIHNSKVYTKMNEELTGE